MPIKQKLTGSGLAPQAAAVLAGTLTSNVTAAGSTQGTATAVSDDITVVTTTASGTGVILRADLGPGDSQTVVNYGANALAVYPPLGGRIANGTANAAVSVAANAAAAFICIDNLNFFQK